MNNFAKSILKYMSLAYKGSVYIYKKELVSEEYHSSWMDIEKRLFINNISEDSIVKGRITISIPENIKDRISEIMLVSEDRR